MTSIIRSSSEDANYSRSPRKFDELTPKRPPPAIIADCQGSLPKDHKLREDEYKSPRSPRQLSPTTGAIPVIYPQIVFFSITSHAILPDFSVPLEDHVVLIMSSIGRSEALSANTLMLPIMFFIKAVRAQVQFLLFVDVEYMSYILLLLIPFFYT